MKKFVFFMAVIFLLTATAAGAATLKYGSRGEEVKKVQTALKNRGYTIGAVDGIFGVKTKNAVMSFQRSNGLVVDGIVGPATMRALGLTGSTANYTQSDLNLLARIISAEARGEPYVGQVAVGAVVLNRVKHPSFPNTISGVIYQTGAFTALSDGQFYEKVTDSAYKAAKEALAGYDPTGGAIYYYNPKTATSKWIRSRPVVFSVGEHVFCT